MKTASLKILATARLPGAEAPAPVVAPERQGYRTAATHQLSGHAPAPAVQAFRFLAAEQDLDVQERLAEVANMVFERLGRAERIEITSGRRKRI